MPTAAGWFPRFWAWLIDAVVLTALAWLFFPRFHLDLYQLFVIDSVIFFAYWMFFDCEGRQSIGKKVMRLKVVDEHRGDALFWQAVVSAFGKSFLLPADVIAGILIKPRANRRLFSMLSRTVVVKGRETHAKSKIQGV